MEITALTAPNAALAATAEARAPRAVSERATEDTSVTTRASRREAAERSLAARRESQRASQEALQAQAIEAASGGSIEFEQDEHTRIMKVLDSKDVLIYQVPPKGRLMLIKAEEAAATQALADA
jgi:hypothetical protein